TEYKKLPALYELDEFYPCLQTSGDLYCYVDALLEYSAQTITHFNHTVVHRGVCMTQTCRQYLGNSTNLDQALEECLNATLYETHQLQTFFIISGFLLAYNILLVEEKTKVDWKMLPKGLVLRWLSRSLVCLMPNSKKPGSNLESNKSVSIATQIVVLGSKKTIEGDF
ncbi:hypothetical protein MSG28_008982, partial [Choristoneura fumiferana]